MTNLETSQFKPVNVAAREARVLGDGPRIQPLRVSELTEDLLKIVLRMIQVNSALSSRDQESLTDLIVEQTPDGPSTAVQSRLENLPEIVTTMLRHPDLFARQTEIGLQLLGHGALPARERELIILRVGWLCQAPYEWGEHVIIAKSVGVTTEEVERIVEGSSAPGWSDHERALLCAVEELRADAMIGDATWAELAKSYNEQQLIELPIIVGQYQTVAYSQNSLRMRLHEGNAGLRAR